MRKIVSGFAASVDGYIEGPNKEYDWILIDKDIDFAEQAKRFDTYLFGRKTYEMVNPKGGKPTPAIKNYVFSTTLTGVHQNYELVSGDAISFLSHLKQEKGKDIAVFGGASLLASILNAGLVDEITIAFIPVLLGKGKPMVDLLKEKVWLKYIESKSYSNGTLSVTYHIQRKKL